MSQTELHPTLRAVTARIVERSAPTRRRYLARVQAALDAPPARDRLGCANLAHAWAALPADEKLRVSAERAPHLGVVTAYNDMLSAHQPYEGYPPQLREEARRHGATLQVAGGVPAMCDGVTQGTPGMDLSLFSRDVIAMATAVALTHQVFDSVLLLGICDKIVPGLLIGALHFGHLPCVFVPSGPMTSGLSNKEKSRRREQYAQGLISRADMLAAESAAYHGRGTCTFYGTANSNQMLLEAMGLHLPGAAFVNPGTPERDAFTRASVRTAVELARGDRRAPIGQLVDERCIVNAMAALLATGGSTNHLIHWVAVAAAAGIVIDWGDFDRLSSAVPLLARVYPNGAADVNQFQDAGGPLFVLRELIGAGLMHGEVPTVQGGDLRAAVAGAAAASGDEQVLRPAARPFSPVGGLRLLEGNLGRAVIKVSAIPDDRHLVEAPARVFDSQAAMLGAFARGEITGDTVVVVRFQGPGANGMPELHKLTPALAVLQDRGLRVALVTDGRMSGASGKVPAAIHVTPECAQGGPLARVRDGDLVRIDAGSGRLEALVPAAEWAARAPAACPDAETNGWGFGRELFTNMRRQVAGAEQGACTWC